GAAAAALEAALRGEEHAAAVPRVYDLAYHFDAAGEKGKALGYALLAAEQARRQFSPEAAANNYAAAKRNAAGASGAALYRIAVGAGESLRLLGRYDEALAHLAGAGDLVDDAHRRARVELLRGVVVFNQGSNDGSSERLEAGLRLLGVWAPRSR